MKQNLRNIGIISLFAAMLVIVLTACGGDGDTNAAASTDSTETTNQTGGNNSNSVPALPMDEDGKQIVARVNGEAITLEAFNREFRRQQLQAGTASYDALASEALNTLIEQRLISQAATEMGIEVSDEEVETEFTAIREMRQSDAEWQTWLDENLFTEEELRQSLRASLITQRTQAEVVELENAQVDEVRARHIVVETEAEAQSVLERVTGSDDFAAVAAEVSKDITSRENGGDLGWFTVDGLLTPQLAEAAFEMEIDEIRGPIQTMNGFHVVQLLETRQREAVPDEAYKLALAQYNEWLDSLLVNATIERYIN